MIVFYCEQVSKLKHPVVWLLIQGVMVNPVGNIPYLLKLYSSVRYESIK